MPGTRADDIAGTSLHSLDDHLFQIVDARGAMAAEMGKLIPQVALNRLLCKPTVANVFIGARNEERLVQNIDAMGWNLIPGPVHRLERRESRATILSRPAPTGLPEPQ